MAKEWYLLKTPHDQLSGFEDDALNDFAQEGFEEALDSSIAVDIELCNYDLSNDKSATLCNFGLINVPIDSTIG